MEMGTVLLWVQVVFGVAGVFLVTREVYRGYQMEKNEEDHPFLKHAQFLYAIQDFRSFYVAARLDQGDSPQQAREFVDFLGDDPVREAVEDLWGQRSDELARALDVYARLQGPKARAARRRDLFLGATFLIISTVMGLWT